MAQQPALQAASQIGQRHFRGTSLASLASEGGGRTSIGFQDWCKTSVFIVVPAVAATPALLLRTPLAQLLHSGGCQELPQPVVC